MILRIVAWVAALPDAAWRVLVTILVVSLSLVLASLWRQEEESDE